MSLSLLRRVLLSIPLLALAIATQAHAGFVHSEVQVNYHQIVSGNIATDSEYARYNPTSGSLATTDAFASAGGLANFDSGALVKTRVGVTIQGSAQNTSFSAGAGAHGTWADNIHLDLGTGVSIPLEIKITTYVEAQVLEGGSFQLAMNTFQGFGTFSSIGEFHPTGGYAQSDSVASKDYNGDVGYHFGGWTGYSYPSDLEYGGLASLHRFYGYEETVIKQDNPTSNIVDFGYRMTLGATAVLSVGFSPYVDVATFVDASHTSGLRSILIKDQSGTWVTPESLGMNLSFDSGALSPNLHAVPEPSSLVSFGIAGVLGLGYGWRRRRKARLAA